MCYGVPCARGGRDLRITKAEAMQVERRHSSSVRITRICSQRSVELDLSRLKGFQRGRPVVHRNIQFPDREPSVGDVVDGSLVILVRIADLREELQREVKFL